MNMVSLLQTARQAGITLHLEDGSLRYQGKSSAVKALLPAIRAHKVELIALLGANDDRPPPSPSYSGKVQPDTETAEPVDPGTSVVQEVRSAERPSAKSIDPVAPDQEISRIRAWLDHIEERDPAIIAEVLNRCRTNPEALVYFLSRAGEMEIPGSSVEADDRRRCSQCANLTRSGRYLAARRGELVGAAGRYSPLPDLPRRCEGFQPQPGDPDQRLGREKWSFLMDWGMGPTPKG